MKTKIITIISIFLFITVQSYSQERFRSGIFLHHSTGSNIWGSNGSNTSVPDEITAYNGLHGYSGDEVCSLNESSWPTDPWNNEWERWHRIFNNEDANADITPFLQSNKIVIIKSCFPSSFMVDLGVPSDTLTPTRRSIYNYKWHWRNFIKVMGKHPEVFFVVWTNAPLVAGETNDSQALFSHQFCSWAKDTLANDLDPVFGVFPDNVYVFDFFHKLVGADYKLKPEYAASSTDSHPNSAATELVAPQFVEEVFDASIIYESIYNGTLQPPVLSSPSNNATGVVLDASLIWGSVSGATSYKVEVSTESDFSTTVVSTTETTTTFTFSNELLNNIAYYWRVKSVNGAGESSWSGVWSFTTIEVVPGPPVLSSPADNAMGVVLASNLTWGSVSGATSYKVEVSTQSNFTTTIVSTTETTTTFTFSDELTNNTNYYWRVRSVNGAGESSWSDVRMFTTLVSTNIGDIKVPDFLVYPNPTRGLLNIDFQSDLYDDIFIWVYSSKGQLLKTHAFKDNNEAVVSLNLDFLKDGVYFVRIKTGGGDRTEKIVLNKD